MWGKFLEFRDDLERLVLELENDFGVGVREGRLVRTIPRRGSISEAEFFFHGKGLRFELPDGRLVDVDFTEDGFEVDWWRFSSFIDDADDAGDARTRYKNGLAEANRSCSLAARRVLSWRL